MGVDDETLLCPSAQPGMAGCQVLGVVSGTVEEPRLSYLRERLPATPEVLKMAEPASPTEVFRLAARCEKGKCIHFDGTRCQLAVRITQELPPVSDGLPPCIIRSDCRWYRQEGKQACMRCPQILTLNVNGSEQLRRVAAGPEAK